MKCTERTKKHHKKTMPQFSLFILVIYILINKFIYAFQKRINKNCSNFFQNYNKKKNKKEKTKQKKKIEREIHNRGFKYFYRKF